LGYLIRQNNLGCYLDFAYLAVIKINFICAIIFMQDSGINVKEAYTKLLQKVKGNDDHAIIALIFYV